MKTHFNKFIQLNLLVLFVLLLIGGAFFLLVFPELFKTAYVLVPLLSFGVNILAFRLATRKEIPASRSMSLLGQLFAIKFFYYLLLAVIYLLLLPEKQEKITFVALLFIVYLGFTFVEVNALAHFVKSGKNNS